jgi:hypothetical protein
MSGVRLIGVLLFGVLAAMLVASAATSAAHPARHSHHRSSAARTEQPRSIARHRDRAKQAHSHRRRQHTKEDITSPAPAIADEEPPEVMRRFRALIDSRSPVAANPIEELQGPKPDSSDLAIQPVYPFDDQPTPATLEPSARPAAPAARFPPIESVPSRPEQVASVVPHSAEPDGVRSEPPPRSETTASKRAPEDLAVTKSGPDPRPVPEMPELAGARPHNSQASWLRFAFLTWGCLLTFGSALRFMVG